MEIAHDDPKDLVRRGYDQISYAYRGDQISRDRGYFRWLDELIPLLQDGDAVLDLGCGCGVPVAQELASRFTVTGVDIAPVQIDRARQLVPQATFVCADMTSVAFAPQTFAAIVSLYALIHLPLVEHRPMLEHCFAWLQPGGVFLATVGHRAWTGCADDWHGAPMYWSHADEQTYLRWLGEIGFAVQWTRFIPEGDGGHTLVLAHHPAQLTERGDYPPPLYEKCDAGDGYVRLEVKPYLPHETDATLAEVTQLWQRVVRPNRRVNIPATKAGLPAITAAIAAGINVNVTQIFSLARHAGRWRLSALHPPQESRIDKTASHVL